MMRVLCAAAVLLAAGCETETRVVRYKPFFTGLEGADVRMREQPVLEGEDRYDLTAAAGGRIVIEHADGSKTLIARNGRHLMSHIMMTLAEGDEELFTQQVLSERTRQEYLARGLDPAEAFRTLSKEQNKKELSKTFARMPMGERSPTVITKKLGRNLWRVKLTGKAAEGLRWEGFDMIMEGGNWRLVWFL